MVAPRRRNWKGLGSECGLPFVSSLSPSSPPSSSGNSHQCLGGADFVGVGVGRLYRSLFPFQVLGFMEGARRASLFDVQVSCWVLYLGRIVVGGGWVGMAISSVWTTIGHGGAAAVVFCSLSASVDRLCISMSAGSFLLLPPPPTKRTLPAAPFRFLAPRWARIRGPPAQRDRRDGFSLLSFRGVLVGKSRAFSLSCVVRWRLAAAACCRFDHQAQATKRTGTRLMAR